MAEGWSLRWWWWWVASVRGWWLVQVECPSAVAWALYCDNGVVTAWVQGWRHFVMPMLSVMVVDGGDDGDAGVQMVSCLVLCHAVRVSESGASSSTVMVVACVHVRVYGGR